MDEIYQVYEGFYQMVAADSDNEDYRPYIGIVAAILTLALYLKPKKEK